MKIVLYVYVTNGKGNRKQRDVNISRMTPPFQGTLGTNGKFNGKAYVKRKGYPSDMIA